MHQHQQPGGGLAVLASDNERERTVAVLREHWTAGRLTLAEFEARAEEAWRGRCAGDLWRAVRNLPVAQSPAPAAPPRDPSGLGTAGVVVGVVGLLTLVGSLGLLSPLSLALSVCALVLGRFATRRSQRWPAAAGIANGNATGAEVLGIVGTVLSGAVIVGYAALVVVS